MKNKDLIRGFNPTRNRISQYFNFSSDGLVNNNIHPAELGEDLLRHCKLSDTQTAFLIKQCRLLLIKYKRSRLNESVKIEIRRTEEFYNKIPYKNPYTRTAMLSLYASSPLSLKKAYSLYNMIRRDGEADETVFYHMLHCNAHSSFPQLLSTLYEYMWSGFTVSVKAHLLFLTAAVQHHHSRGFWTGLQSLFTKHKEPSYHHNRESLIGLIVEIMCISESSTAAHNFLVMLSSTGSSTKSYLKSVRSREEEEKRKKKPVLVVPDSFGGTSKEICVDKSVLPKVTKIPLEVYINKLSRKTSSMMAEKLILSNEVNKAMMYNSPEGMLRGYLAIQDIDKANEWIKKIGRLPTTAVENVLRSCSNIDGAEIVLKYIKDQNYKSTPKFAILICDILSRDGLMHAAEVYSSSSNLRIASPISMYSSLLAGYASVSDTDGIKSSLLGLSHIIGSIHRGVLESVLRYVSNEHPVDGDWDLNSSADYNWTVHVNDPF